jgi:long-chain acyl-CoA synthetase
MAEARRWSDRPFVLQGDRTVSFADHELMVRRIVAKMRADGVGLGDRVAIFADNSPEWIACFFAALSLGAIVVPCNCWWAAEELAHVLSKVDPAIVVTDQRRFPTIPPGQHTRLASELAANDIRPDNVDFLDETKSEDDAALILYTAGTTGFPKGAVLSHRALVANLQTLLITSRKLPHQISQDTIPSITLVGLPLFHIGAIQMFLVPLVTGGRLVFLEGRFDEGRVLSLIESHGVTMFSGVPTMMERMLRHGAIRHCDLSSLRTVVLGGAPVDNELLARVRSTLPRTSRGLGRTYGLTEAGGVVSTGVGGSISEHPGSVGRPVPVVEIRIAREGESVEGDIFVRSPAAMDGYWGEAGDNVIDSNGWIDTGDVGFLDEHGYLYVSGRRKDVVIRGGENIASARVESVLRSHPAVAEAAVVGLPDSDLGEVVGAAIILAAPGETTVRELENYARSRLAHFEVPQRWWLRSGGLPINAAGKIVKSQLVTEWPPTC